MTLPDGAEVEVDRSRLGRDLPEPPYRVCRHGITVGEFTRLHDIALFVRYRHDQAAHDALIKAHIACLGAPRSGLFAVAGPTLHWSGL